MTGEMGQVMVAQQNQTYYDQRIEIDLQPVMGSIALMKVNSV
jgi:hypothetical protein